MTVEMKMEAILMQKFNLYGNRNITKSEILTNWLNTLRKG
jgi:hypothetical protein